MEKSFLKDFSWYFIGSFIPILISVIKTPIFTRHFDKQDFGYLGIVSITYSYLGMILFSWIGSCIWRYYIKFEENKKLKELYSNLIFLVTIAFSGLLVLSIFWYLVTDNNLIKSLIFYSFFYLILNQLYLFYMIIVRLKGRSLYYTLFQTIKAIFSLFLVLFLVFRYNLDISALILSLAIIDAIAIVYLILFNPVNISFGLSFLNKESLIELIKYGSAGLVLNVSFFTITYSDRYIIALFNNIDVVGLYDQIYKLCQLSIVALVTIYFNSINPHLLNQLEKKFSNSVLIVRNYLKIFILIGLPIVIYLSLFSKEISNLLLGEKFRLGYTIMPFVFFASYLQGVANFYELRMKFSNNIKKLSFILIFATFFNVVLTFLSVWLYGYKWAAYSTLITYLLLILIFHFLDNEVLKFSPNNLKIGLKILIVISFQIAIYFFIFEMFVVNIIGSIIISTFFVLTYGFFLRKEISKLKLPIS